MVEVRRWWGGRMGHRVEEYGGGDGGDIVIIGMIAEMEGGCSNGGWW